jgi:hypothetical protein
MTERQDDEFTRLGLPFGGLWGRRLYAIDGQGPVLRDRQILPRSRPPAGQRTQADQSAVHPTPEPIRLFFPLKWGINNELPSQPVLSDAKPAQHEQAALF